MDMNSDSSMLSDELKPRRTPVPSSFVDAVPRPSVPDLSIIEIPPATVTPQANVPPVSQPHPTLSHLSYNDWRLKTGGVIQNSMGYTNTPIFSSDSYQSKQFNVASSDSTAGSQHRQQRSSEYGQSAVRQPSGKVVSYSDYKPRPSTAPTVRTQHTEFEAGKNHPLSKSTPPSRFSNQFLHSGPTQISTEQNYCAAPHVDRSKPQTNQNGGLMSANGLPVQNFHYVESNTTQSTNSNSQNNLHGSVHGRQGNIIRVTPSPKEADIVPSSDKLKNFPQYANYNSLPHHIVPTSEREIAHNPCVSDCCQSLKTNTGPWPYAEQICCPSTSAFGHHGVANHIHSMPPCVVKHGAPFSQVSYEDLYKIVLAQNDQLKALQAQVERLIISQDTKAESAETSKVKGGSNLQMSVTKSNRKTVMEEGTQTSDCESKDDESQKMSIGVMTSFIHAVTYRGRVGRTDAAPNVSEHESAAHSHPSKQSKSSSSDDYSSSSSSSALKTTPQNSCTKCCEDCTGRDQLKDRSRKRSLKNVNLKGKSAPPNDCLRTPCQSNPTCQEGCNCNNPGVSAAITAVRGCQAVLANRTGMTGHDFSTFNGTDLPTVTEQPVSPVSSIHVDLHEYHSTSSDELSDSEYSEDASYDESQIVKPRDQETHSNTNGWTFYHNVLGQVNKILEEKDTPSSSPQEVAVPPPKQTDVSVSKRVAFEQTGSHVAPQNLKEMAIRYLRENHPEELTSRTESKRSKNLSAENVQEMSVYNMPASNMSFATFRYLERYNLLPENFDPQQYLDAASNMHRFPGGPYDNCHNPLSNGSAKRPAQLPSMKRKPRSNPSANAASKGHFQPQLPIVSNGQTNRRHNPSPVRRVSSRKQCHSNTPTSKILDITTLRQQPKLL